MWILNLYFAKLTYFEVADPYHSTMYVIQNDFYIIE
nr:MAG TPA: hypothetical protein [Caudoviricetes sp.]